MADIFLNLGWQTKQSVRFYSFKSPYVCKFIETAYQHRVKGLLNLPNQYWQRDNKNYKDNNDPDYALFKNSNNNAKPNFFDFTYKPNQDLVDDAFPTYDVDFELSSTYSQYNWELFFHIPLFIASRLMQDQRHEEAMHWFHTIFNPTSDSNDPVPKRYWFFKPFHDAGVPERIQEILLMLHDDKADQSRKEEIEQQIRDSQDHPFQPHRVARGRPGAYQKNIVMKYIDNLIAWGDKLFRRDTIESINEATQLYILAADLLGARPAKVSNLIAPAAKTYAELRSTLDAFSNAAVKLENKLAPYMSFGAGNAQSGADSLLSLAELYFCIPHNEKLMTYWDTVEDRLFKIRHCMNIEGVVRQLPLFEPPIDPALLVRATALGLDLNQVLDDLAAPLPHYRFAFMLQKAREFCEELKQSGNLLLSVLEKKDAEKLARVRATHEKELLKAVLEIKKKQVKEAEENKAVLEKAKESAEARKQHYEAISNRLPEEQQFLDKQAESVVFRIASQEAALAGSMAAQIPEINAIAAGTNSGTSTQIASGKKIALIANLVSTYLGWLGDIASLEGTTASYKGGLIRAQQDRNLQIKLATMEISQIDKQIAAADIRLQIAENELANHEKQIEQSAQVEEFLKSKFTNTELYNWMVSQISAVYFQTYKLVYAMAKQAERAYRHELGIADSGFIQFGAWDSLHRGLLAGENLSLALRRLEQAYIDNNRREYELTRHVSLNLLDPLALIKLRLTGECEVAIPEALFDLDYAGHYMRRIKSVGLSIPCVSGPYTNLSCTLTLLKHQTRAKAGNEINDPVHTAQSIATSAAANDSGLFELSFRDERFLPFEGVGAISTWRLQLPQEFRQFDYDTISDVIFHIRYTARNGGDAFQAQVTKSLADVLNGLENLNTPLSNGQNDPNTGLLQVFSLRHEFPNDWHRLKQGDEITLTLGPERMPYFVSAQPIQFKKLLVVADLPEGSSAPFTIGGGKQIVLNAGEIIVTEEIPTYKQSFTLWTGKQEALKNLTLVIIYSI